MENVSSKTVFIVEHMEPYLFEWCLYEYLSMKNYLKGFEASLWITNAADIYTYKGEKDEENRKYLKELEESFAENGEKYKIIKESLAELGAKLEGKVCMLDMRGEKELSPDEHWDYLIFGGILGDHPPRDRPAPLRQHFKEIRHLGELQLATDTAVLISRLILCNKRELKSIPLIKEPTVKGKNKDGLKTTVQMEGFSYVSKELDIETGKIR
jgi:ribosome biogenesis SPOUT family RNA methylase Rps3